MASANTLCKKILNVKGMVVESTEFYEDLFGVQHLDLQVRPTKWAECRCPKCGRIHKENRHHHEHEYVCDKCGYRSNDDRVGAMNIWNLGTLWVSGDERPRYGIRKDKGTNSSSKKRKKEPIPTGIS